MKFKNPKQPEVSLLDYDRATAALMNYLYPANPVNEKTVNNADNDWAYILSRIVIEGAGVKINNIIDHHAHDPIKQYPDSTNSLVTHRGLQHHSQ